MNEILEKILNISVQAPSGHNSQPWRFVIDKNIIQLWNIPEKDKILFNYKQRGSLIAHGAVIENIHLMASKLGYDVQSVLFPDKEQSDLVAELIFTKGGKIYSHSELSSEILNRKTNRRAYENMKLTQEDLKILKTFSKHEKKNGFEIFMSDKKEDIETAAKYFSVGDRLIFENKYIHKALFSNVNWTEKEEEDRREGLFIKTKELSPISAFLFKNLLSRWNVVKHLQWLKISEKARKKREVLYKETAVIGIITAPDLSQASLVRAGRIMQRFWLTVTKTKISFQPLTVGLLYLGQKTHDDIEVAELTKKQASDVQIAYDTIINKILKKETFPVFSFRLGYAKPPTAQSLKKKPVIVYKR